MLLYVHTYIGRVHGLHTINSRCTKLNISQHTELIYWKSWVFYPGYRATWLFFFFCKYCLIFRARQHQTSLAPIMNDCDGQMIFGEPWGPNTSWHLSYKWGKTPKKPHPGNLSRPGIEHGPAAWQGRMLPPAPQRWLFFHGFPQPSRQMLAITIIQLFIKLTNHKINR